MSKRIALLLLPLFVSTAGIAQQNFSNYDSVKQVLARATHDSTRVSALSALCRLYMYTRPDSSLYYGYEGLTLSRKTKDAKEEVQLLRNISSAHFSLGNRAKALQLMLQAVRVADENKILNEKAILLMILSTRHTQEFSKRLAYLKEAEELLDSLRVSNFAVVARTYIADLFLSWDQLDSAIFYGQTAYEKSIPLKAWWVSYRVLLTLGHIEQARGNYDLAIEHFRNARSVGGTALGDFDTNFAIAKFFQETNDLDSCIFYARRSLDLAREGELYSRVVDASTMLSGIYEKTDINKAYEYSLITIAAKDSIDKIMNQLPLKA